MYSSLVCAIATVVVGLTVTFAFNIDVDSALIHKGPNGSQFGYSLAFKKQLNSKSYRLIVGAPKDSINGVKSGSTYTCRVKTPNACTQEYIKSRETKSNEEGELFPEGEMYGSFLTVTPNSSTAVCANLLSAVRYGNVFTLGRCEIDERDTVFPPYRYYEKSMPTPKGHQKRILYNAYAQMGFSGDSLPDGSIVLGAPGFMEWRGGIFILKPNSIHQFNTPMNMILNSYLGYAVSTGKFCGDTEICFAASAPQRDAGQVYICPYRKDRPGRNLIPIQSINGEQIGSYFGASLAAIDLNGDGWDDLVVGAPFYTDFRSDGKISYDEGRVTVFLNRKPEDINGEGVIVLDKHCVLKGPMTVGARYGTAVANIGDINKDNFEDIAVGAPYEDEGRGVVYIYHGSKRGLETKETQRIYGRDIGGAMTSFGWSFSKPADVDSNKYPDIAVGSPESDMAVILKTRPIIRLKVNLTTIPATIPLGNSTCQAVATAHGGCFKISLCFQYRGASLPQSLAFNYTLHVDTKKGKNKRVMLLSKNSMKGSLSGEVNATRKTMSCQEFQAVTLKHQRVYDSLTGLRIEASLHFLQNSVSSSGIPPILNKENQKTALTETAFDLPCTGEKCVSDLDVTIEVLSGKHYSPRWNLENVVIVNSTERVIIRASIANLGDATFANFVISWSGSVALQTTKSSYNMPVTCESGYEQIDAHTFKTDCHILAPIDRNFTEDMDLVFDVEEVDVHSPTSQVHVAVSITASGKELSLENNSDNVTIPVLIDSSLQITGKADPDRLHVWMNNPDDSQIHLHYTYMVTNFGPSILPSTDVIVRLPYSSQNNRTVVTVASVTLNKDGRPDEACQRADQINDISILSPSNRREGSIRNSSKRAVVMDCGTFNCMDMVCGGIDVDVGENVVVNVTVTLLRDQLSLSKGFYLKYLTTLFVKQPNHVLCYPWTADPNRILLTAVYPHWPPPEVSMYIIIAGIAGGLVLLFVLVIILWKCGFFKRQKKDEVTEWRERNNLLKSRPEEHVTADGGHGDEDDEQDKDDSNAAANGDEENKDSGNASSADGDEKDKDDGDDVDDGNDQDED